MKALRKVGYIFIGLELVLSIIFMILLVMTSMVPLALTIIVGVILFALPVLFIFMLKKKKSGITALILSFLLCCILPIGIFYLFKTNQALNSMTGANTEVEQVNVYVKIDDPVSSIAQAVANGYVFGILADNSDTVNETVADINEKTGSTITTSTYPSVFELVTALENGEIQSIIAGQTSISALDSTEGYEGYSKSNLKIIMQDEVETEVEEEEKTEIDTDHFCAYFSGIDTYGSVNVKSRSDVNIIGVVNMNTHQIILISTPRDYYIPLSVSNGSPDKLTHAGIYGVDCSMDTLGMLYDTTVDRYVRVNFSGFKNIIDELGGVEVYSDATFTTALDETSGEEITFNEGMNTMTGKQALAFARDRHHQADGDFARGRHQMEVIRAVVKKMVSSDMLKNYGNVMDSMADSMQTSMDKDEVGEIVQAQLASGEDWTVLTYSVSGVCDTKSCYSLGTSASVVIPNEDDVAYAKELIKEGLAGTTFTQEEIDQHVTKVDEADLIPIEEGDTSTETPISDYKDN